MPTNAIIGSILSNGKIKSIFCSHDGYIPGEHGAGYKLFTYYQDPNAIEKLLNLGALTELGSLPEIGTNSSRGAQPAVTCSALDWISQGLYEIIMATTELTMDEFNSYSSRNNAKYIYIFDGTQWWVKKRLSEVFVKLSHALDNPSEFPCY